MISTWIHSRCRVGRRARAGLNELRVEDAVRIAVSVSGGSAANQSNVSIGQKDRVAHEARTSELETATPTDGPGFDVIRPTLWGADRGRGRAVIAPQAAG